MTFEEWWREFRGFDDPHDGAARAAWGAAMAAERERCARLLDAAHEQRKHLDNYAALYARMIRECRLIDWPNQWDG